MPLKTLGTKSLNQGLASVNGVGKPHTTHLIATSYDNACYAALEDITKSTARFLTADARQGESVESVMTTPTTTAPFVTQTSKPLNVARDVNRG